ncbi:hypothetical protein Tco_0139004, partial [Tanacetum coccineum]
MDNLNITMKEYIKLEEEKAQSHGRTFNWQTAAYGKMEYCKEEDDSLTNFETEYPATVFDNTSDASLSCEPTVSPLNENEIDFRISFDKSDDEDYMVFFDENSFSYKIISIDNLKIDSENENDKVNMPLSPGPTIRHYDDLDFLKDFENEFPAITYNNDLTSKLTEPSISFQHIEVLALLFCKADVLHVNWTSYRPTAKRDLDRVDQEISVKRVSASSHRLLLMQSRAMKLNMAPLPSRDQRHPWLRYQVEGYTENILHSYEQRLETIWGRSVNRVHILYFAGLTEGMRKTLGDRLRMVYTRDEGQGLFTSHAWRILFETREPLVREFILKFLSTYRMSDTEMGLDVADTLCFQLGGVRRRMTWRQFILALGLHTDEEMAEASFRTYWLGSERVISDKADLRDYWIEISSDMDFLGPTPSYAFIRDPVRRLCYIMIVTPRQGGNARRNENGYHHNTMVSTI